MTKTTGKKSMREILDVKIKQDVRQGILAPLAFFGLYGLPLSKEKIWQLLYRAKASQEEFDIALGDLVNQGKIYAQDGWYGLKKWDEGRLLVNKPEIEKRWQKVARYYKFLSLIPFVEHMSIIHSLAIGNVDQESDIDFLVMTKPSRLYFARSIIIILFRMLGVYKTRKKISEQFCFGYYLTTNRLDISQLEGQDDFLAFWFASHIPILGPEIHDKFLKSNAWIYGYFPNYQPATADSFKVSNRNQALKKLLEILLWWPAAALEPLLRQIHIQHTFNLPENRWPTSTTIATKDALKLHAVSQRRQINEAFERIFQAQRGAHLRGGRE